MARNQSEQPQQQPDRFTEFIHEITLGTRVLMVLKKTRATTYRSSHRGATFSFKLGALIHHSITGHQHCRVFLHARRARRVVQVLDLRRSRAVAARMYGRPTRTILHA
jgi:hypothetical protein